MGFIREWRVNNFIRNDRYHKTCHAEEYHSLIMLENGKYTLKNGLNTEIDNVGIPNDNLMSYQRYPEVRLGKVSKVHSCKSASANCARAQLFLQFWKAYPKKKGKANCEKWFTSHKPDEELVKTMIAALDTQRLTEDWTKENGRYIPLPYTWLNGKRWEDEITVPSMPKTTHEQFKEVSL